MPARTASVDTLDRSGRSQIVADERRLRRRALLAPHAGRMVTGLHATCLNHFHLRYALEELLKQILSHHLSGLPFVSHGESDFCTGLAQEGDQCVHAETLNLAAQEIADPRL
jgi:hypothetical protein